MRRGTILFLLGLILLIAFVGLLRTFAILAVVIVTLIVLLFAALFIGAWLLKRRMHRKLAELQQAFIRGQRDAEARRKHEQMRSAAIDVEPADVRDDRH